MRLIPIIAARCCAILCGVCLFAPGALAVTFEGLYEAEVPVESQAPEQRPEALRRALATVLVRVTGRREAPSDPAVAALLDETERFVQQFGYTVDDKLRVGFDGAALRDALLDAGQPVWGSERPATLLWLAIDSGSGQRTLIGADSASDVTELLESVAAQRGIPLVLPLLDSEDLARISFSDIWGGFDEAILAASERYGADAVLVGRAGRSFDGRLLVRWILHFQGRREEWRSTLDDGLQHAADRFARVFAPPGDRLLRAVRIDVSGIDDFRAYGAVSQFLESLTLVQSVGVEEVSDDRVVFRVALRGEAETLDRAISLGHLLEPVGGDPVENLPGTGADLEYRFRQ